jgi:hypothetical protein
MYDRSCYPSTGPRLSSGVFLTLLSSDLYLTRDHYGFGIQLSSCHMVSGLEGHQPNDQTLCPRGVWQHKGSYLHLWMPTQSQSQGGSLTGRAPSYANLSCVQDQYSKSTFTSNSGYQRVAIPLASSSLCIVTVRSLIYIHNYLFVIKLGLNYHPRCRSKPIPAGNILIFTSTLPVQASNTSIPASNQAQVWSV